MEKDYLQLALKYFNGGNWYTWKKYDDDGKKILNDQRMCYECIEIIKDGATMPTEAEVNAKIQEIKDQEEAEVNAKATGKQKLIDLGLSELEIKALMGA
tara:strand:+ start:419 stop:715 length:297 start_codon:yes stop_codon:yes gene_type:complete